MDKAGRFMTSVLVLYFLAGCHPPPARAQAVNAARTDTRSFDETFDAIIRDRERILNDQGRSPSAVLVTDDQARPPNDATVAPNDATQSPNDATRRPNDARSHPNDATRNPNDATLHPNDATLRPNHLMY